MRLEWLCKPARASIWQNPPGSYVAAACETTRSWNLAQRTPGRNGQAAYSKPRDGQQRQVEEDVHEGAEKVDAVKVSRIDLSYTTKRRFSRSIADKGYGKA